MALCLAHPMNKITIDDIERACIEAANRENELYNGLVDALRIIKKYEDGVPVSNGDSLDRIRLQKLLDGRE